MGLWIQHRLGACKRTIWTSLVPSPLLSSPTNVSSASVPSTGLSSTGVSSTAEQDPCNKTISWQTRNAANYTSVNETNYKAINKAKYSTYCTAVDETVDESIDWVPSIGSAKRAIGFCEAPNHEASE